MLWLYPRAPDVPIIAPSEEDLGLMWLAVRSLPRQESQLAWLGVHGRWLACVRRGIGNCCHTSMCPLV